MKSRRGDIGFGPSAERVDFFLKSAFFLFPKDLSCELCEWHAKSGVAVEHSDRDLEVSDLSVEVSCHDALVNTFDTVHPLTGRAVRSTVPRGLLSARLRR
ncbi:hypothetical protein PhaeoP30_00457 [Phaeobacter inhibens]|nr:hypothetical protein PhaeoP30_00457 [Phaeobacter inhibens]AUR06702.1 hypothetical protein PhaeoP59_00498 [Phaeobacter inhibens]AUR10498.1 hypothetical protein PhaeoP48_00483 [Phaeobacter inhibens]